METLVLLQRRLGITVVFVTHDQGEALSLSDRIVVMKAGRIEQIGSPDDGTDPDGFSNGEFFVPLKPFDQWRKGLTKEGLVAELADALR